MDLDQLHRRLTHGFGVGRLVAPVQDMGPTQLHQLRMSDGRLRDNTQSVGIFGLSSAPPVGTDAAVLFIGGVGGKGVVLGTNHQDSRPRSLNEGETLVYSLKGLRVHLSNDGIVIDGAGLPVTIKNTPGVTQDGYLRVKGEVTANYGGASVTLSGHRHGNGPAPTPGT